jgi:hypothetical protein
MRRPLISETAYPLINRKRNAMRSGESISGINSPAGEVEVANSAVSMILYALGIDSTFWISISAAKLQYVLFDEDMAMQIEGGSIQRELKYL